MSVSVTQLHGIGVRVAEKLGKLGIRTIEDLLFHFPFRYQDRTRVYSIASLPTHHDTLVRGTIEHVQVVYRGRRTLVVRICDKTGCLELKFFYFSKAQQATLGVGRFLRCFGTARRTKKGLEMIHPEYRFVNTGDTDYEPAYMPVYPTIEGINQFSWRKFTDLALNWLRHDDNNLEELLPQNILVQFTSQASLKEAIRYIHRPPADADIELLQAGEHPAQKRLALEEMLAHTLGLRRLCRNVKRQKAIALSAPRGLFNRLQKNLPFHLTNAQQRVVGEIFSDLSHAEPMVRLVQGDVGSGKTLVAVAAMLAAVANDKQAALMAPTEILAEQHYQNLHSLLNDLGFRVCLLTSKQKTASVRASRRQIRNGEANIVVGTHALFQKQVEFAALALLVVDEQHRFGVHQRLAFKQKGEHGDTHPHQLIMTATPIPRSLAMTMYADFDYSVIDELPPGRQAVKTVAIADTRRDEVIERVRNACLQGWQAFWVCPLIKESEKLQYQTAEQTYQLLQHEMPEVTAQMIHGQTKPAEREAALAAFKQGEISLLVATTIIEVGVDVPNAGLMIIENAERFGLAQLHQLRGRVGRNQRQASCVLMYSVPLSPTARRRLDVMKRTNDGFEVAQEDMRIRGPGEVLGTRQTGEVNFRIADLARDMAQLSVVRSLAEQLAQSQPEITDKLITRWLGAATKYAEV